jgi:hypothetical protein
MVRWLTGWLREAWRARRSGGTPGDPANDEPITLSDRVIELAPLPPDFDRVLHLKSQSAPHRVYQVNLGRLECSCSDYTEHRRGFAPRDVRRVCKHLRLLLDRRRAFEFFDEIGQAILRPSSRSRTLSGVREVGFVDFRDDIVLGWETSSPWISVITRRGPSGPLPRCARYTYHVGDRRWAHGSAPAAATDITRAGRSLIGQRRVAA